MSASLVNNDVMKQRVKETNIKSIALHEESINHNGHPPRVSNHLVHVPQM